MIGEMEKVAKKAVEEDNTSGSFLPSSLKASFSAMSMVFNPCSIAYANDHLPAVKESYPEPVRLSRKRGFSTAKMAPGDTFKGLNSFLGYL
jgi:hypothetical protein